MAKERLLPDEEVILFRAYTQAAVEGEGFQAIFDQLGGGEEGRERASQALDGLLHLGLMVDLTDFSDGPSFVISDDGKSRAMQGPTSALRNRLQPPKRDQMATGTPVPSLNQVIVEARKARAASRQRAIDANAARADTHRSPDKPASPVQAPEFEPDDELLVGELPETPVVNRNRAAAAPEPKSGALEGEVQTLKGVVIPTEDQARFAAEAAVMEELLSPAAEVKHRDGDLLISGESETPSVNQDRAGRPRITRPPIEVGEQEIILAGKAYDRARTREAAANLVDLLVADPALAARVFDDPNRSALRVTLSQPRVRGFLDSAVEGARQDGTPVAPEIEYIHEESTALAAYLQEQSRREKLAKPAVEDPDIFGYSTDPAGDQTPARPTPTGTSVRAPDSAESETPAPAARMTAEEARKAARRDAQATQPLQSPTSDRDVIQRRTDHRRPRGKAAKRVRASAPVTPATPVTPAPIPAPTPVAATPTPQAQPFNPVHVGERRLDPKTLTELATALTNGTVDRETAKAQFVQVALVDPAGTNAWLHGKHQRDSGDRTVVAQALDLPDVKKSLETACEQGKAAFEQATGPGLPSPAAYEPLQATVETQLPNISDKKALSGFDSVGR